MARRRLLITAVTSVSALALAGAGLAGPTWAATAGHGGECSAGAHTLSPPGAHVYPDTGNGGYTSVHTDVHLVYDGAANKFLPGNHVVLTDRATQCLTSFSLDFERKSANTADGPDMRVKSVKVNGHAAAFTFVQPTYPGDPNGQDDPNPLAHEASQNNPVGGPANNPLPPACSPELPDTDAAANSLNGTQCPANKLVITPKTPIRDGSAFTVKVSYTGKPGVHNDGDGTTEGWFRSSDGGFVTTEPVGTEDWMPLNDHPTAKPTYDFYDTVPAGLTAVANGMLKSVTHHGPDARFSGGSATFHWHSRAPIASYLVENSVGHYTLTSRVGSDGIRYYQAQDASISAAQQQKNLAIMNQQQDITDFESHFNGPFPFTSDGIIIGTPDAGFEEEMQTMITFASGEIDLGTLYHENMHQWWGDNVTEGGYNLTFFKEGMATLGEDLKAARDAETKAGGPGTAAGKKAFTDSLIAQFNKTYARAGGFWTTAPSNPTPYGLFANAGTYERPAAAYIALWQILGTPRFTKALRHIQRHYGGGHITEAQLEAGFRHWLPNKSAACENRLSQFFTQWFDTAYPSGGGANKPAITGPGLAGAGFYDASGGCPA
jgi:hypothetical protein